MNSLDLVNQVLFAPIPASHEGCREERATILAEVRLRNLHSWLKSNFCKVLHLSHILPRIGRCCPIHARQTPSEG